MKSLITILEESLENFQWFEKIRLLRKSNNWTIKVLADKCGTTEKSVHSWETGKRIPTKRNRRVIASVFRVYEREIFGQI